jgi:hypothetical protein
MKVHIYKGNKIVEYADGTFDAYYMPDPDGSAGVAVRTFKTLEEAQHFLDDDGYSLE